MARGGAQPLEPNDEMLGGAAVAALRQRVADLYGMEREAVLVARGVPHAIELVLRRVALDGASTVAGEDTPVLHRLAEITRLSLEPSAEEPGAVILSTAEAERLRAYLPAVAEARAPALVLVDDTYAEFADTACSIPNRPNLLLLRSLQPVYGAPCAALLGPPPLIARLAEVVEPEALPAPVVESAAIALSPARVMAAAARIAATKAERRRLLSALQQAPAVEAVTAGEAPRLLIRPRDRAQACAGLRRFAVAGGWNADGSFRLDLQDPSANDRALAAFGAVIAGRAPRRAAVVRETAETRIAVEVDLDAPAAPRIATGVGFFDHMLAQVATHGGIALQLSCEGDLEIDAHHTIEDCAIALGQALRQALAERRGIARFGFVLPMDEAEAKVSVDLGGRPYLVFDGSFSAPLIGAYPTEMTEHVFRSLAQGMGAAIHVAVTGANDHHKTEACFKAFGRALRQAVAIEGEALPSTKGMIE